MTKKFTLVGIVVAVILSLLAFFKPGTVTQIIEKQFGASEFNTGKIVHNNLADQIEVRRTVTVTPAQINELSDDENGIELIPAVGSDRVIIVDKIIGFARYASEGWSRASGESFEIKWNNGTLASGSNNYIALGASFSNGFFTSANNPSRASPSAETWYPYNGGDLIETGGPRGRVASSSAVILTGLVDPDNVETTGITDFVFEIFYKILTNY